MYRDQAPVHYPRPSPRHQRHASSRQYRDQLGHQPLHVARTAREPAVVTSRTAREPAVVTQPRWTGSSDDRKDYDKPVAAAGFAICLGCLLVIGGVWCGIASLTFAGEFLQRWVVIYHWWKLRSNVTSIGHKFSQQCILLRGKKSSASAFSESGRRERNTNFGERYS